MNTGKNVGLTYNHKLLPFCLPWTVEEASGPKGRAILRSRKFSAFYLLVIWFLPAVFGFASNYDCNSSWQLSFLCDQAVWPGKLVTDTFVFIKSLFTSIWIHNGILHLLFVTIIGFLLIVQSFEMQFGWRRTIIIFFATHIIISFVFVIVFSTGKTYWPTEDFFVFGFERNWMGGSVGFYGILGALAFANKRPWFLALVVVGFESVNHFILGTSIHIGLIHISSFSFGVLLHYLLEILPNSAMSRSAK